MRTIKSFGKSYDRSWMTDPLRTKRWGLQMQKFREVFDAVRSAHPLIKDGYWLPALGDAKFIEENGLFYAALPKEHLPKGFEIDGDYWIIDAPFAGEDELGYTISQYGMDIYGR